MFKLFNQGYRNVHYHHLNNMDLYLNQLVNLESLNQNHHQVNPLNNVIFYINYTIYIMSDPYDWPFPSRKDLMYLSSISKLFI